ncbi:MAG: hypothetical protein IT429_03760 [Gemmataceae bacterium]|nr:hypothetical protein [Gemmataceae bacterium]
MFTVNCSGCQAPLRVREEYAGKEVKCPRCGQTVTVPAGAAPAAPAEGAEATPEVILVDPSANEYIEEVRPIARASAPEPMLVTAVEEGPPDRYAGRYGPAGQERYDDREAVRRRRAYRPCPSCGAAGAERVTWTPWGSFYGPSLLTHVRCPGCGYAYNGRTGRSNAVGIFFFALVPFLLLLGINVGLWLAVGRIAPWLLIGLYAIEGAVVLVLLILALVQGLSRPKPPPAARE